MQIKMCRWKITPFLFGYQSCAIPYCYIPRIPFLSLAPVLFLRHLAHTGYMQEIQCRPYGRCVLVSCSSNMYDGCGPWRIKVPVYSYTCCAVCTSNVAVCLTSSKLCVLSLWSLYTAPITHILLMPIPHHKKWSSNGKTCQVIVLCSLCQCVCDTLAQCLLVSSQFLIIYTCQFL